MGDVGLPIMKQVVEQRQGMIELHSLEGQGSAFVPSLLAAD